MAEPKDKTTSAKAEYAKRKSAQERAAASALKGRLIWYAVGAAAIVIGVIVVAVVVF